MIDIDTALDEVQDAAADFLNSEGRSGGHVALGVLVTVGIALAATAGAARVSHYRHRQAPETGTIVEKPRGAMSLILPAMFSATTLSALRVWNAPSGQARDVAMRLWAVAQGVNALWLAARPRSLGGQLAAAMSSAGLAAAFAHHARRIDRRAGILAAPQGMGVRVANRVDKAAQEAARTLH